MLLWRFEVQRNTTSSLALMAGGVYVSGGPAFGVPTGLV